MNRGEKIAVILTAARKRMPEIVERRELEATDGNFYSPFGIPLGVEMTGKTRIAGYVFRSNDGSTYGKRHSTRAAAEQCWNESEDKKSNEFAEQLVQMSDEEINSQFEYWRKRA